MIAPSVARGMLEPWNPSGSTTPARWPSSIDELARRAAVRARHRVPRRAHLLAAPRARAGRVAGRHRARSTRSPSTSRRSARSSAGPGVMVAHAAEQDLAILERACGRRADAAVRHAGRGRLHRPRHAVARVARRAAARRAAHQGRPAHRLDPPAAARRADASTPRPTSSTCSRCTTCSSRGSSAMGRLDWATDECEERRLAHPHAARARDRVVAHEGRAPAARHGRAASRSRSARGASAPPSRLDVPPRFVLSDLALIGHRAAARRAPRGAHRRSAASTAGLARRRRRRAARRGRRPGSRSTRRRCALPESDHIDRVARARGHRDRRVARATRVGARPRPGACSRPAPTSPSCCTDRPSRLATGLAGRPRRRADPAAARGRGDDRAARRRPPGRAARRCRP